MKDTDSIIEKVKERFPELEVKRRQKMNPSGEDGIRYFSLPDIKFEIQIESGGGDCRFIVETEEQSGLDQRKANTVDRTVEMIVEYFDSERNEYSLRKLSEIRNSKS